MTDPKPYTRADYGQSEERYNPGRVLGPFESIIDNRRLDATVAALEAAEKEVEARLTVEEVVVVAEMYIDPADPRDVLDIITEVLKARGK